MWIINRETEMEMEMEMQILAPGVEVRNKDPTLYTLCIIGNILLFALNLTYLILLLFYIADHDYSIVTEWMAAIFTVAISFGCFAALATLYTAAFNEQAYHDLRKVCLDLAGVFVGILIITPLFLLIESMSPGNEHYWKLYELIIWPVVGEVVMYLAAAYAFYNMYKLSVPYVRLQSIPQQRLAYYP